MKSRHGSLRGIRILYEDTDVIVIEKESGILTCATCLRRDPEYCVESALTDYVRKGQIRSSKRVYLVHRLDRGTSGVMMVVKTREARDWFRLNWNEVTEKIYLARVVGSFDKTSGVFESYLSEGVDLRVRSVLDPSKGKLARTEWETISEVGGTTLVKVTLKSGRKNQIRVHFAEAGRPVAGDSKYGGKRGGSAASRLCLHAWRLTFVHPHSKKKMTFETDLPAFACGAEKKETKEGNTVKRRPEKRKDKSGETRIGTPSGGQAFPDRIRDRGIRSHG